MRRSHLPPLLLAGLVGACAGAPSTTSPTGPAPSTSPASAEPTSPPPSSAASARESASPSFGPPTVRLRIEGDAPVIPATDGPTGYRYGLPAAAARSSSGEYLLFIVWFGPAPGNQRVTLARSPDGLTWEVGEAPIYTDLGLRLADPDAVPQEPIQLDDGSWVLYGWGAPLDRPASFTSWRASAPAPDGPWAIEANHLVPLGESGTWDSQTASLTSVIRGPGGFLGWYEGQAPGREVRGDIGFASSDDGLTWRKLPEPIISPGFCGPGTAAATIQPQVERWGDGYLALIAGHSEPRTRMEVFAATSRDGVEWRCDSGQPVLAADDIPGSHGIHTMKSVPFGDRGVALFVESLASERSDIWLAIVEPAG